MRQQLREGILKTTAKIPEPVLEDDLVKSHRNDGFVKSSPATGGTRRAKTEE
jgi:hypothetical protein